MSQFDSIDVSSFIKMAQGNPGALNFLMELTQLDDNKIAIPILLKLAQIPTLVGTNLYVLYSDLSNKDMSLVAQICHLVPNDVLEDACSRQDYSGRALIREYLINDIPNTNHGVDGI